MANVEIILREDVPKLGKSGEVVKVSPGFARNYLLPRNLAIVATQKRVRQLDHEKKVIELRSQKERRELEKVKEKLVTTWLTIAKPAGEEGKLYGSVTGKEIAAALVPEGLRIDKRKIELPEPIRAVGDYQVTVRLGPDLTAEFKLSVTKK